jgi:hypothetical protein
MNVHLVSSLENKNFDNFGFFHSIHRPDQWIYNNKESSNTTGSNILEGFSTQKSWASWKVRKSDLKKKTQNCIASQRSTFGAPSDNFLLGWLFYHKIFVILFSQISFKSFLWTVNLNLTVKRCFVKINSFGVFRSVDFFGHKLFCWKILFSVMSYVESHFLESRLCRMWKLWKSSPAM